MEHRQQSTNNFDGYGLQAERERMVLDIKVKLQVNFLVVLLIFAVLELHRGYNGMICHEFFQHNALLSSADFNTLSSSSFVCVKKIYLFSYDAFFVFLSGIVVASSKAWSN